MKASFSRLLWKMQRGNEDQRCIKRLIVRQVLTNRGWDGNLFSNPFCLSVFLKLLYYTQIFQIKYSWVLEKCLLLCVFISIRVQLVKRSLPYLINVLWMNVFNTLTTGSQLLIQVGCSLGKSVKNKSTKGLQHRIDVAHIAYMNVLSQQSESILVSPEYSAEWGHFINFPSTMSIA